MEIEREEYHPRICEVHDPPELVCAPPARTSIVVNLRVRRLFI